MGFLVLSVFSLTQKNEIPQKTINESKIINLNAQQLIINDSEVKKTIGEEWNLKDTFSIRNDYGFKDGIGKTYNNSNPHVGEWIIESGTVIIRPVYISILTFPNLKTAKEYYNSEISKQKYKENGNQIDIGDNGYASTVDDIIKVIFIKNNVVSIIYLTPNKNETLTVDQAIQLAKKQEEKIDRILDVIQ